MLQISSKGWRLGLLLGCLLFAGCFRTGVSTDGSPPPQGPADVTAWHHHFLFGIIAGGHVAPSQACAHGVRFIKTRISLMNVLLGLVTVGIYYPTQVQLWCRREPQATARRLSPMSRPAEPR